MSEESQARPDPKYFDLGHQGDFDRGQIAARLRMTPTEVAAYRDIEAA